MKHILLLCFCVTLAFQAHANPFFVDGNPTCEDLGFGTSEYKVEPVLDGTYSFDGVNSVTLSNVDGRYFDWSSTLSFDAVIVKGGPNANVWVFDPEASSGMQFSAPINPENETPYGLSHVSFCYDYELTVSKTADTSYYRNYDWNVEKSVDPTSLTLEVDESGTLGYTVVADSTGYTDSGFRAFGTITAYNPSPMVAVVESVNDTMGDVVAEVDCGVELPYSLAAGATLECSYGTPLPDGTNRTNVAEVVTSGTVLGGTAEALVDFGTATVTELDRCADVTDPMGGGLLGTVCVDTAPQTYTYSYQVGPYDTCGLREVSNTATVMESDSQATSSDTETVPVDVICRLVVTKTANAFYTHSCDWTIDKSADASDLTLAVGQQYQVNYVVDVGVGCEDSAWRAEGLITIENPAPEPISATLTGVSDVMGDIAAEVDCLTTFPLTLGANASLTCRWWADLPDGSNRTNVATVTTSGQVLGASGSAEVDFGTATVNSIDECVVVSDTNVDGPLSPPDMLCEGDAPETYRYSKLIGPYQECDTEHRVDNVAGLITNDTGTVAEDSWTVLVTIPPCDLGCTLTPGYWKTHSEYGPAPYDDTWSLLPDGADSPFYLSGQSFYGVLWTPPKGNVYYNLSRAYIAALLNGLNGADMTAVLTAMDDAEAFFEMYTPAEAAGLKGKSKNGYTALAEYLDDFNNGLVGPGHCDADALSAEDDE